MTDLADLHGFAGRALPGGRRSVRIGITGLARAGKTALLTSIAGNLLAMGHGGVLPALQKRLGGRRLRVALAPAGAADLPRFGVAAHLAALAAEPPDWPARTSSTALLALDVDIARTRLGSHLPPRRLRLEFLDYPGEWLLDLALLAQDFAGWSEATLRRLADRPEARAFLSVAEAMPAEAPADEALAASGHALYVDCLRRLQAAGLSYLQPGRFLMPPAGPPPPWLQFFPVRGRGGLQKLMASRFDALRRTVRADLSAPLFGSVERLVVLADLLGSLHAGPAAFADASQALAVAAGALAWPGRAWHDRLRFWRGSLKRVAFVASKSDHVAERQRGNLARLTQSLANLPSNRVISTYLAVAAIRCTEDFAWALNGGHPVSAVRGRVVGDQAMTRSYPGEVPDHMPDAAFWAHPFLAPPNFAPPLLPANGRYGVPNLGLDALLVFLLEDLL